METAFLLSGSAVMILGAVLTKWLSRVIGKARSYYGFFGLAAIMTGSFYFLKPENVILIFVVNLVISFSLGPVSVLQWVIYTDAADYSEWKKGRRATGLLMSASLFSLKFGLALGASALTWMLARYGYKPNQQQTEEALKGIRLLMSIFPAIIAFTGVVLMFFYPLSNKNMLEIETDLVERRKQAGDASVEE
jgi:GPH family glycoside/pentoside/hexuronide:cation symporter